MLASFVVWAGAVKKTTASCSFFLFIALLVQALSLTSTPLLHATTVDDANQEAVRIQQQQQQRLDELEERARERVTPLPQLPTIEPPALAETIADQVCIQISAIRLEGNSLLSNENLSKITDEYLNHCLSRTDINNLLRKITRLYFDIGYITTRAYLKPQDLSQGTLVITVIEGRIESMAPDRAQNLSARTIFFTFPAEKGSILNLRDLEQGLDQLNRLRSNSVRMMLEPGTDPGDTHIRLENEKSRSWHLMAGLDNGGQKSTGEYQGHLTFSVDNVTGLADYFNLNISHDIHPNRAKMSRSIAGQYELPWKWWQFNLSSGFSDYHKELHTTLQTFDTSGSTQNYRLSASRVVHRNQSGKSSAEFTLNLKDERNYLEDAQLNNSSQKLTIGRIGLSHRQKSPWTVWGIGLTLHQGIPALGASSDKNLPADAPKSKFNKLSGNIAISLDISIDKFPLLYALTTRGQYSNTVLYGSEQISIGGYSTVRGYADEGFSGDRGIYFRNDLSTPLTAPKLYGQSAVDTLEPFITFDWGSVKPLGSSDNSYNTLAGWGIGLHGRGEHGQFDLLYARPINPPDQFTDTNGKLSFSISIYM